MQVEPRVAATPSWVQRLLLPALLYLVVRSVGVLVLTWMAAVHGTDLADVLVKWDGRWLVGIAQDGYSGVNPELTDAFGQRDPTTSLAFFPGFPALVGLVAALPLVGPLDAALALNTGLGVAAAVGTARLATLCTGSRAAGLWLVVLLAAAPMGVVLSMAYSEALFVALAVWALVGLLQRHWWLVGWATAAAGLVRPTGAALVVVVVLAALLALRRGDDGTRPAVALALAPLGLAGYLGWVGWRTGSVDGWFVLQRRGWGSGFDGGAATVTYIAETLQDGRVVLEVAAVAILLVSLALVVVSVRDRLPWPVVLYGALVTFLAVASDGIMTSKPRLLLPAFVLLIPVAVGLAERSRSTQALAAVAVVGVSAWFGAYTLTVYPFAI